MCGLPDINKRLATASFYKRPRRDRPPLRGARLVAALGKGGYIWATILAFVLLEGSSDDEDALRRKERCGDREQEMARLIYAAHVTGKIFMMGKEGGSALSHTVELYFHQRGISPVLSSWFGVCEATQTFNCFVADLPPPRPR